MVKGLVQLPPGVIVYSYNAPYLTSAGALPQAPLWELTTVPGSPDPLAGFKGAYF